MEDYGELTRPTPLHPSLLHSAVQSLNNNNNNNSKTFRICSSHIHLHPSPCPNIAPPVRWPGPGSESQITIRKTRGAVKVRRSRGVGDCRPPTAVCLAFLPRSSGQDAGLPSPLLSSLFLSSPLIDSRHHPNGRNRTGPLRSDRRTRLHSPAARMRRAHCTRAE